MRTDCEQPVLARRLLARAEESDLGLREMPRKEPLNFDVDAWMGDPGINLLRPSSRAAWFDALCRMHDRGRAGKLSGTIKDLAVLCRCTPTEMRLCVDELKLHDCADVAECHSVVTLTNRRMSREAEIRKSCRERKVRERERLRHANVTGDVTDQSRKCHTDKSDGPPPPDGFSPLIPLSSLPPSPIYIPREKSKAEGTSGSEESPAAGFESALEAFGRWSGKERGYGLKEHENEHRPVMDLVGDRSQCPPIIRSGEEIGQNLLIAQAVDVLMQRGVDFKTAKYAAKSVKNELDEWARKGIPGAATRNGKTAPGPKATPAGEWADKPYSGG